MKSLFLIKRSFLLTTASLAGAGLLFLAGCASSMMPASTQSRDSGITSVLEKSLETNEAFKAGRIDVQTREGQVYLSRLAPGVSTA